MTIAFSIALSLEWFDNFWQM